MGRRPGRAAAKHAAAAMKNTPQEFEEDEIMADVPTSEVGSPPPKDEDDENSEEEEDEQPARDSEPPSEANSPPPQPVIRRKRLGRPPKNRPADWDQGVEVTDDMSTPKRGRRGGFRGGGRWARRGGPSHVTQQPIDKEGNLVDVINDEVDLPKDEEGEKKVDRMGNLQGDRQYRCRTFTVLGRGKRLYMLSTEPARCVGFRDSYLFFTKHKRLFKIIIEEDEKRDLIDRGLIPHSYKGRAIGICTARSVFREFGAQIIVGGRRIIDDYEVAKLKEEGVKEGEIADPSDIIKPGEPYNTNQYVAWHGASAVYHSGQPTVPLASGKVIDGKKRRVMVNDVNWQLEHAREASQFNGAIGAIRKSNMKGVYEPHTNQMHYPKTMQPTHARWEQIDDNAIESQKLLTNGHSHNEETSTIFPPVPPVVSRNFMVVDTVYESAPRSGLVVPGPDGEFFDVGFAGLSSVSDEVKAELPPECLEAFEKALAAEKEWKNRWGTEDRDGLRKAPRIDKGYFGFAV